MDNFQLKLVFREIKRSKLISSISILGLGLAMAVTVMIITYVRFELSYDSFHKNAENIYRINSVITNETENIYPLSIAIKDSSLQKQLPEVNEVLQIYGLDEDGLVFKTSKIQVNSIKTIYSDPNIHKVFGIRYLLGNPDKALLMPNSVVLTREVAVKLFGTTQVIGELLSTNYSKDPLTVTGVIEELPVNSHLKIDAIIPLQSVPYEIYKSGIEVSTYVLFQKNIDIDNATNKTREIYKQLFYQRMKDRHFAKLDCFLQKLTDIHLKSGFQSDVGNNYRRIIIYFSLSLIILIIAVINYINLMIASYEGKMKTISIQKITGASRKKIINYFILKSLFYSILASFFACFLIALLIPSMEELLKSKISLFSFSDFNFYLTLIIVVFFVGLVSGCYPALVVSKYQPARILKGGTFLTENKRSIKGAFVILQFTMMIFLIIGLLVMRKQIEYIKNSDLGFKIENLIVVRDLNHHLNKSYPAISDALKKIPEIESFAASYHMFGNVASGQYIEITDKVDKREYPIKEYRVFPGLTEILGLELIAGRMFNEDLTTNAKSVIINQTTVRKFGLSDPLNTSIIMSDTLNIIGVVKDFHYYSMEEPIEPIMFTNRDLRVDCITLKLHSNNIGKVLPQIESAIKAVQPDSFIDFVFLEDFFRNQYGKHEQIEKLFMFSSILSLVLAMLGLFALSKSITQKRTKEIGIRKVNGAKVSEILKMLNKGLVKWVVIAFLIATPIAWYAMHKWLENFAYKTEMSWWVFVLAGFIALLIALLTVSWQTWRATRRNPVEALRYE